MMELFSRFQKEITIDQINKIVGVAWSDKLENGIGKVNLSIGRR